MAEQQLLVPDIGDVEQVEIIELLIAEGQAVAVEESLIVLESDKATMDVPAEVAGIILSLQVKVGDQVSTGDVIATIQTAEATNKEKEVQPASTATPEVSKDRQKDASNAEVPISENNSEVKAGQGKDNTVETTQKPAEAKDIKDSKRSIAKAMPAADADIKTQLVVLGSGPGGYTAAFRAADLGVDVVLIERYSTIGGVCLNVGCIPSKALLHQAQVINETADMGTHGVHFEPPTIDIDKIRDFKNGVINKLTSGLSTLAKQRNVTCLEGVGQFTADNCIEVIDQAGKRTTVGFENAIIAAGSAPVQLPFIDHSDERVIDSTGALALADVPERLLVVGGGIIGLEMAQVYDALGSKVTIVELADSIIPGADKDIITPLYKRIKQQYDNIYLSTKLLGITSDEQGMIAKFEGKNAPESETFDRVLVAVGRSPNGKQVAAEKAGVEVTDRGFIEVDAFQQTNVPHIYAIGDIVGQPMLAHKAVHEGKVAAEVIAGMPSAFSAMVIPSVAYTDPEVAFVGVTENQAKQEKIDVNIGKFPWAASGRSLSIGRTEGLTKAIFDQSTGRLIGAAMTGTNAGELIAEAALAIEMGADAHDIGATIHPHPTLSETLAMAAEMAEGTITDLIAPKRK